MIRDEIDPKIRKVVSALNKIGVPTASSCQGHSTHGSPAPWVKITAKNEPRDKKAEAYEKWVEKNLELQRRKLPLVPWITTNQKSTKAYKKWNSENLKLRKIASRLLSEFYKNRHASKDVRITIGKAKRGFWIHNGGEDYTKWRKKSTAIVKKKESGKIVKGRTLSSAEVIRRKRKLPMYQKEMNKFAAFLEAIKD